MRWPNFFIRAVVLASSALVRASLAFRRAQVDGAALSGHREGAGTNAADVAVLRLTSASEEGTAAQGPWRRRRLQARVDLPAGLRDLVMQYVPILYYWIALGRRSANVSHVGVWEIEVSFRGHASDHLRLVGDFTPCRDVAHEPREVNFAAFLPRGDALLVACKDDHRTVSLEAWQIPSRHPKHRLERGFSQPRAYFPYRRISLEHFFSHTPPKREVFIGATHEGAGMWNTTSWDMLWYLQRLNPRAVALSPRGDTLAVVEPGPDSAEETVTIREAATGQKLCEATPGGTRFSTRGSGHQRLGFSGKWLTVCDPYGWTSVTYRVLLTHAGCLLADTGHREPCCDATGSGLILYGTSTQVLVRAMGSDASRPLFAARRELPFKTPRDDCLDAKFSPDGKRAIFRDRERWFLWPFADGRPPRPLPDGVVFSDDGELLVGLGGGGLRLIETRSGTELDGVPVKPKPNAALLSPRDYQELLAVGGAFRWRPPSSPL